MKEYAMKPSSPMTFSFVRNFLCLAFVALAAGCATGPNFKTYSATLAPPKSGESRVWFYRPSAFGALVQPVVYLDGSPLFKAQPGCFFYADKPPGTYEVKCVTEWADKRLLTVVENAPAYVKLSPMIGLFVGHIIPNQTPEEKALKEIQGCHLITADGLNRDWKPQAQPSASSTH
jgi:hypothetical protein